MVAAVALLFDLALLYLLKVNFSRRLGADQLGPGGAGGAAGAAPGQAGGARARPLAAADGDRRHRPQRARDRRRLRRAQQPSRLPGAGVPRPRRRERGEPSADLQVGGRAIPVLPLDAQAAELPGWLGQPHVVVALELDEMLGREGLIESLSFYHGDIDVISPLEGPADQQHPGQPLLLARHPVACASTTTWRGPGRSWSSARSTWPRPRLLLAVHRPADGAGGGAGSGWPTAAAVIFAHTRVGRHGQLFPCYKFRTMVANSAEVLAELLASDPVARAEWDARPQAAPRPPDHRRSAASCARPASTSCRSCSTWCAAR